MTIHEHTSPEACEIRICGRLDTRNSVELRKSLKAALERHPPNILVDINGLEAVDSSGIATFLECLGDAWARGGELRLFGAGPKVEAVVEIFRLQEILPIFSDRQAALRHESGRLGRPDSQPTTGL